MCYVGHWFLGIKISWFCQWWVRDWCGPWGNRLWCKNSWWWARRGCLCCSWWWPLWWCHRVKPRQGRTLHRKWVAVCGWSLAAPCHGRKTLSSKGKRISHWLCGRGSRCHSSCSPMLVRSGSSEGIGSTGGRRRSTSSRRSCPRRGLHPLHSQVSKVFTLTGDLPVIFQSRCPDTNKTRCERGWS